MKKLVNFFRSRFFLSILVGLSVASTVYFTVSTIYGDQYYENWESIEVESIQSISGESIFPFEGDIQYQYYLGTLNKNRAAQINEMTALYNRELADLWRLFDKKRSYEENHMAITNVHAINAMAWPTDWLPVDNRLFEALQKASLAQSVSDSHYNLFAGKLNDFWYNRFYDLHPEYIDPAVDAVANTELASIVAALDTVTSELNPIEFDSITHSIKINVESNSLLELDFQYLQDALAMEALNDYFATDAVDDSGFFISSDGYLLTRGNNPSGYLNYWSFEVLAPTIAVTDVLATVSFASESPAHQITFSDVRHPLSYYYSPIDDVTNLNEVRHPYYSAITGFPSREIRSISLIGKGSLVEDIASMVHWIQWNAEFISTTMQNEARMDIIVAVIDTPFQALDSSEYDLTLYEGFTTSITIDDAVIIND